MDCLQEVRAPNFQKNRGMDKHKLEREPIRQPQQSIKGQHTAPKKMFGMGRRAENMRHFLRHFSQPVRQQLSPHPSFQNGHPSCQDRVPEKAGPAPLDGAGDSQLGPLKWFLILGLLKVVLPLWCVCVCVCVCPFQR